MSSDSQGGRREGFLNRMMSSIKKTIGNYTGYNKEENDFEDLHKKLPLNEADYPPFVDSRKSSHHRPSFCLERAKETRSEYLYHQQQQPKLHNKVNSIIQITQYIANAKYDNTNDEKSTISMLSANNSAFKIINKMKTPLNNDYKKIINYNDFHQNQINKPTLLLNRKHPRDYPDDYQKMSMSYSDGSHQNKINKNLIEHIALNQNMKKNKIQATIKSIENIRTDIEKKNKKNEEAMEEMQRVAVIKKQKTNYKDNLIEFQNTKKISKGNMFDYLYEDDEEEEKKRYPQLSLGYSQGFMYKGKAKEINLTMSSNQSFEFERVEKKVVQNVSTDLNIASTKNKEPIKLFQQENDNNKKPVAGFIDNNEAKNNLFFQKNNSLFTVNSIVDNEKKDIEVILPNKSLFDFPENKPLIINGKKEEMPLFDNLNKTETNKVDTPSGIEPKKNSKDNNLFNEMTNNENINEKMKQFLKEEPLKPTKVEEFIKESIISNELPKQESVNLKPIDEKKLEASSSDNEPKKEIILPIVITPISTIQHQNEGKLPEKPIVNIKPKEDKEKELTISKAPSNIPTSSTISMETSQTLLSNKNPFLQPTTLSNTPSCLFSKAAIVPAANSLFPQNTTTATSSLNALTEPINTTQDQMEISPYTSPKANYQSFLITNNNFTSLNDTSISPFTSFPKNNNNNALFKDNSNLMEIKSIPFYNASNEPSLFDTSRQTQGNNFANFNVPQANAFSAINSNIGMPQANSNNLGSLNTTFALGKKKN